MSRNDDPGLKLDWTRSAGSSSKLPGWRAEAAGDWGAQRARLSKQHLWSENVRITDFCDLNDSHGGIPHDAKVWGVTAVEAEENCRRRVFQLGEVWVLGESAL